MVNKKFGLIKGFSLMLPLLFSSQCGQRDASVQGAKPGTQGAAVEENANNGDRGAVAVQDNVQSQVTGETLNGVLELVRANDNQIGRAIHAAITGLGGNVIVGGINNFDGFMAPFEADIRAVFTEGGNVRGTKNDVLRALDDYDFHGVISANGQDGNDARDQARNFIRLLVRGAIDEVLSRAGNPVGEAHQE